MRFVEILLFVTKILNFIYDCIEASAFIHYKPWGCLAKKLIGNFSLF